MRARRSLRSRTSTSWWPWGVPNTCGRKTSTPGSPTRRRPSGVGWPSWSAPSSASASGTSCWLTSWVGRWRPMATPEIGVLDIAVTEKGRADPVFGDCCPRTCPDSSGTRPRWSSRRPVAPCSASNDHSKVQALRVGPLRLVGPVPRRGGRGHRGEVGPRARVRAHPGRALRQRAGVAGRRGAPPRRHGRCRRDAPHRLPRRHPRARSSAVTASEDRDGPAPFPPGLAEAVADRAVAAWLDSAGLRTVHLGLFDASGVLRQKRLDRAGCGEGHGVGMELHRRHSVVGPSTTRCAGPAARPLTRPGSSSTRGRPYPFGPDCRPVPGRVRGAPARPVAPLAAPAARRACRCGRPGGAGGMGVRVHRARGWRTGCAARRRVRPTRRGHPDAAMAVNRCWSALTLATEDEMLARLVSTLNHGAVPVDHLCAELGPGCLEVVTASGARTDLGRLGRAGQALHQGVLRRPRPAGHLHGAARA